MALPFFYMEDIDPSATNIYLTEETSKHVVQVLRMKIEEQLRLTDGKGNIYTATIVDAHRKKCSVIVTGTAHIEPPSKFNVIAISLVKNVARFEWFLEKATEMGISGIIPLICNHTEKQHFRHSRMKGILISAMLQSQQSWLPELHEPQKFSSYISECVLEQKFIAHCEDESEKYLLKDAITDMAQSRVVLVGPEGDFSKEEIAAALHHQFIPVSLGNTRLRSETAGMVAAVILCIA